MDSVTTTKYQVGAENLQRVFQKHKICPEYPIDAEAFVKDIHEITNVCIVNTPNVNCIKPLDVSGVNVFDLFCPSHNDHFVATPNETRTTNISTAKIS